MKKFTLNFKILGVAAFVILLVACERDYNKFQPYETVVNTMDVLKPLRSIGRTINLDPTVRNTIITDENIIVELPENAFVDAYGIPAMGEIVFSFHRIEKLIEYMAYGISMESDEGQLLKSKALFFIGAYSESEHALYLQSGKTIQIKYPSELLPAKFSVYFPKGDNKEIDLTLWTPAKYINGLNKIWTESWSWESEDGEIKQTDGYIVSSTKLKWISIAEPITYGEGVNIEIELSPEFTGENTMAYLVTKGGDSILKLEWNEDRHRFCDLENKLPPGLEVNVLVLSNPEPEKLYFDTRGILIQDDTVVSLFPKQVVLEEVYEILNNL